MTHTELLAAARESLLKSGFLEIQQHKISGVDGDSQGLFEDAYSLVAIVIFETWNELSSTWANVQASFVELLTAHIPREDNKLWDCYLLLWTTDVTPANEKGVPKAISYDTGRLRKMVANGIDLREISDVSRVLLPLLPISEQERAIGTNDELDRLPQLISPSGVSPIELQAVIDAFRNRTPLVKAMMEADEKP